MKILNYEAAHLNITVCNYSHLNFKDKVQEKKTHDCRNEEMEEFKILLCSDLKLSEENSLSSH